MKRFCCALLLLTCFFLPALAQTGDNAMFWKISGHGLQQPSYLMGTMHVLCKGDAPFTPAQLDALKNTEALYLEIKMDDPNMQADLMQALKLKDGETIKDKFKPADLALAAAYFRDSLHTNLEQLLSQFKLFLPSAMLISKMLPCSPQSSLETDLMLAARKLGHPVLGLETVAAEMASIDEVPDSIQVQSFMRTVSDMDLARDEIRRMREAYLHQRMDSLVAAALENEIDAKETKYLTVKRNQNWMPVIEKAIHEKPVFIACGALHLATEDGLLVLLRKAGYTLTPVR